MEDKLKREEHKKGGLQSDELSVSNSADGSAVQSAQTNTDERKKTIRSILIIVVAVVGLGVLFWIGGGSGEREGDSSVYQTEPTQSESTEVATPSPLPPFDGWNVELPDTELLSSVADAPNIIYSTVEGSTVSLLRKNTQTGQKNVVFSYRAYTRDPGASSSRTEPIVYGPAADISSDGSKVAYVDSEGLKVYDLGQKISKSLITITQPENQEDHSPPTWSEPEMTGTYILLSPRWSVDGRYISFIQQNFEGVTNGVIDVVMGKYSTITGGADGEHVWSPSENRLAITGPPLAAYNPAGLFVSQKQNVAETVNVLSENAGSATVNFSPDGRKLVAVVGEYAYDDETYRASGKEEIVVMSIDGSSPITITSRQEVDDSNLDEPFMSPFFSQDGQAVYFGDEVEGRKILFRHDLAGGQTMEVAAFPNFYQVQSQWTPQGYLALLGNRGTPGEGKYRLFVLDLENEAVVYSSGLDQEPLELVSSE